MRVGPPASAFPTASASTMRPHSARTGTTVAPQRSAISIMRRPKRPHSAMTTRSPGSKRETMAASRPARPVPGTGKARSFSVWKTARRSSMTSLITAVNSGSNWPRRGVAIARSTRGSAMVGPAPSRIRAPGTRSPRTLSTTRALAREPEQVVDFHRPAETLQRYLPHRLGFGNRFHRRHHALLEQDLAGLGLGAETGREIGDGANGAIVHAPLEADGADGGIAVRDAETEVEVEARLLPPHGKLGHALAHGRGHPHRALRGVRHRHGVIEEDHHAVARESLEGPLRGQDQLAHGGVVLAQHRHDFLGLGGLGKSREAAEVEEDHGDLAPVAFERILRAAGDDHLGELGREEALELAQAIELADLLGHPGLQRAIEQRQLVPQLLDPEEGADPREELRLVDGLGQEVVGARLY